KGAKNARLTLLAGFTTVRNVGASSYGDVALRDAIAAGEVPGPRMYVSGPPVGIIGGHCSDENLLPEEYGLKGEGVATGPWEMRAKVRENIKYGVDLIKTCSTGGVFSKGTALGAAQGTLEEMTAIAEEAHARGLKVASHAHGTVGIRNALLAGIDTIEHASILDDETIQLAKEKGGEIEDLTVCILDRPRHQDLINAVRAAGARINLIGDGDVSAVIATTDPSTGIDLYVVRVAHRKVFWRQPLCNVRAGRCWAVWSSAITMRSPGPSVGA
ncbi:MAG: fructose-bisphosphatase class II, partial [Alphaproteobacteria bacterium]|nr:fructose-bisphosphatase class II [Alphaproteobacteria bacterium]